MSGFQMKPFTQLGEDYKIDLVCGMKVDPANPPFQTRYKGEAYYFCSEACRRLFEREPEKYIQVSQE